MHPASGHLTPTAEDAGADARPAARGRAPERRARGAAAALGRAAARDRQGDLGRAASVDRDLLPGVDDRRPTSASWQVVETPGHAPSHVCLHQPERRLLISGDHLLGRVSLYFDEGYTPRPGGRVPRGRSTASTRSTPGSRWPATAARSPTSRGHVDANRSLVAERLDGVRAALAQGRGTAYELAPRVYGEAFSEQTATWLLTKTRRGSRTSSAAARAAGRGALAPERWVGRDRPRRDAVVLGR